MRNQGQQVLNTTFTKLERVSLIDKKLNHLLIKKRTIIGFVLCALGTQLGLVGWLLFSTCTR